MDEYEIAKNDSDIIKDKNMINFLEALYDDLNTPKALAVVNEWFYKVKKDLHNKLFIQLIKKAFEILGLNTRTKKNFERVIDKNIKGKY